MAPCRVLVLTLPLALCTGTVRARNNLPAQPSNEQGTETADIVSTETFSSSIEVTTTRIEGSVLEAPVAVTVIPSQQIETSPATNMANLLRGVPGLNVIQISARDVEVRARGQVGVAEKSELVLLDGRSIYVDYYGYVAWDTMPINFDEIERIEVQQGPGSALWGANAMSGVINLITKSPRQMNGGLATLAGGERGYRAASARWSAAVGPWSYKLSTSFLEQDPWPRAAALPSGDPIPTDYSFENSGTEQAKANVRVDYERESGKLWSYRAGVGSTSGIFHSSIGPFLIEEGSNVSYLEGVYTSGTLDGRAFWNRLRADAPALLSGLPARFETDTYVGELTKRLAIGNRQVVVVGGDARLYRFDLSIAPLGDSRSVGGIFAGDQIELRPTLDLYLGGRLDEFDTIGTVFSPRLSLVWQPVVNQSLRVSFSRSYRAPALLDNYLQVTTPGALDLGPQLPPFVFFFDGVGNPDLEEERMDSVELGYSSRFGSRTTLTAGVYVNQVRDNIFFHPVVYYGPDDPPAGWPLPPQFLPPGLLPKTFGYSNVGKVRNQGVELGSTFEWRPGVFSRVSYTYQDEPRVSDLGATPLVINQPSENLATFSTSVVAGAWSGSFSASYVDRAFWADVLDSRFWGTTEAFVTVDASVSRSIWNDRAEWRVSATNLFDEKVQQHAYGDIIGRQAALELRVHF